MVQGCSQWLYKGIPHHDIRPDYYYQQPPSHHAGQPPTVPPAPKPFPKIDCPEITFWTRAEYRNFIKKKKQEARATNGSSSTTKTTRWCHDQAHPYLQYKDGTLVMGDSLTSLSMKIHSVWLSLHSHGITPKTFSKMSSEALEFLLQSILPLLEFKYILYCDNGHWKLKEWCKQNYSSWTRNNGI